MFVIPDVEGAPLSGAMLTLIGGVGMWQNPGKTIPARYGDRLQTWADQSGHGNDVTLEFSGVPFVYKDVRTGNPVAAFDNTLQQMRTAGLIAPDLFSGFVAGLSLHSGSIQSFVGNAGDGGLFDYQWSIDPTDNSLVSPDDKVAFRFGNLGADTHAALTGNWHILGWSLKPANVGRGMVDGDPLFDFANHYSGGAGHPTVGIAIEQVAGRWLLGLIGELWLFPRTLTDAEMLIFRDYLNRRWNVF